ncbi:flagellin N-terminal helical domain-containing protein [Puerhibacterium puerhi]|uniref:flagellin N-terminal helical domain-containing protein n=1 Tax=Puerhibacterium puerhi TaxID=2692623 RepID=UPI001356DC5F|nr:flagellin [Puerhibacterium puerhi]
MALSVNQNIAAVNAYRNLSNTQNDLSKSLEKLSSGLRINRAADDAAGLAISEGLRSQVGGLKMAARNAQDGISVVQTAEGALTEVHSMLQRMNDLAVQHASGAQNADSKKAIESEFDQLKDEIQRIQNNTKFNDTALFGDADLVFQVGYDKADTITIAGDTALKDFSTAIQALTLTADPDDATAVVSSSNDVQAQITAVSTQRAELGAIQNRFEHTVKNVNVAIENLSASESRIRDTDMASEMVEFTRAQILSQAGTAMLAQAKSIPQSVLQLLQ